MLANLLTMYTGVPKAIFMLSYKWKLISLLNCGDLGEEVREMEVS